LGPGEDERDGSDGKKHTSEVVTTDIVHLSILNQLPNVRALQVFQVVVVRGAQLGAHAAVVAGDDNAAAAGGNLGVDAVLDAQAGLLAGVAEDGGVLVVAGAAKVHDAVGRQDVLGAARRVLGRAAGDQFGIVVVEQVLEDVLVLGLGQDGVVGLKAVFLEQGLVAEGLNVCEGRSVYVGLERVHLGNRSSASPH
jgi:hypothetical protein